MIKDIFNITLLSTLLLFPLSSPAETLTTVQNINTMYNDKTLTTSNSNTIGVTNFVTYTCTSNARFAIDGTAICISLPQSGSAVTTSCIKELAELRIDHVQVTKRTDIKIYISTDSVAWEGPLSTDNSEEKYSTYSNGSIVITLPRNNYYLRVKNTSSNTLGISAITYYQDHCNCFLFAN